MKVCFVSPTAVLYGAEKSLLELAGGLRELGVQPYFFVQGTGPLVERLEKDGIPHSTGPFRWWVAERPSFWGRLLRITAGLWSAVRLAVQIRRCGCAVVYTNTILTNVGAVAAWLAGRPHIWHIHELGYEDDGMRYDMGPLLSGWFIAALSDAVIVVSEAVRNRWSHYVPSNKLVLVRGAPTAATQEERHQSAQPIRRSDFGCVVLGRIHRTKGQEDAIRALGLLSRDGIEVRLRIVGDGDTGYIEFLKDLASRCGVTHLVEFSGYAPGPLPYLQAADVVLVCSRTEGFGRVTLEAMLCGKPVIGTNRGGTPELIVDNFNGMLYEPGDFQGLAHRIRLLYDNRDDISRLGRNGQRWALETFNKQRYVREIWSVLARVSRQRL